MSECKSGFVAIIGRPNVGKSTLMNYIVGQKIAITSNKPQTTRNRIHAIHTEERGQIVFVDTPGLHKAQNKLGEYMVRTATQSYADVDLILWLVEASEYIGPGDRKIAESLANAGAPVVLVINKIDSIGTEAVFPVIDAFRKLGDFAEIVPVSAQTGQNVPELLDVIFDHLEEGPCFFDPDQITDQPERQVAAELIREKTLRLLKDEVPHGIAVVIDRMEDGKKICQIDATIICERDSHKGIIIGKQGAMLKRIGSEARADIEHMLDCQVNLKLWVKVKRDWRESDYLVKNYGYKDE